MRLNYNICCLLNFIFVLFFSVSCATNSECISTIDGMVYDGENEVLYGVTVSNGEKTVCRTDIYGHFYIPVSMLNDIDDLYFTKPGYEIVCIKKDDLISFRVAYIKLRSLTQLKVNIEDEMLNGNMNKASELIDKALKINQQDNYIKYLQASLFYRKNKYKEANNILNDLCSYENASIYVILLYCKVLMKIGEKEKAINLAAEKSELAKRSDLSKEIEEILKNE